MTAFDYAPPAGRGNAEISGWTASLFTCGAHRIRIRRPSLFSNAPACSAIDTFLEAEKLFIEANERGVDSKEPLLEKFIRVAEEAPNG